MDILKKLRISYYPSGREAKHLTVCFDNGSPYTFIKYSAAIKLGKLFVLPESEQFGGLGSGRFYSNRIILIHIKVLKYWCRQLAYVVDDDTLEKTYDILVGRSFMQSYGIKLIPYKGEIEIDKARLELAQRIR